MLSATRWQPRLVNVDTVCCSHVQWTRVNNVSPFLYFTAAGTQFVVSDTSSLPTCNTAAPACPESVQQRPRRGWSKLESREDQLSTRMALSRAHTPPRQLILNKLTVQRTPGKPYPVLCGITRPHLTITVPGLSQFLLQTRATFPLNFVNTGRVVFLHNPAK